MIYADNAATTLIKPEKVIETNYEWVSKFSANSGRSGYYLSMHASDEIYACRETIAKLFNISSPEQISFTYNATYGINMALKGILKPGDHVLISSMEHNATLRPIHTLSRGGVDVDIVTGNLGKIDSQNLKNAIKPNTRMVICNHVSNVSGTIQPLEEIGRVTKEADILLMVDTAQSAGIHNIDVELMNIDILAFTGHKSLYGLQGTGGVYIRDGIDITPMIEGGTGSDSMNLLQPAYMPDLLESGTLNVAGIASLRSGIDYVLDKGIDETANYLKGLTAAFIKGIEFTPNIKIYGIKDELCGTISVNVDNRDSVLVADKLFEKYEICVRGGLQCAPLAHKTLETLSTGTVRFSFSGFNTLNDVEYCIHALKNI